MNINIRKNNVAVSYTKVDSLNELKEVLRRKSANLIIPDDECGGNSYLLDFKSSYPIWQASCGLCFGTGVTPEIMLADNTDYCWIGYDCQVSYIDLRNQKVLFEIDTWGSFWEFIPVDKDKIVIVHELGAVSVNTQGRELWSLSGHDILADFKVENGKVKLIFEDGQVLSHSLE